MSVIKRKASVPFPLPAPRMPDLPMPGIHKNAEYEMPLPPAPPTKSVKPAKTKNELGMIYPIRKVVGGEENH